MKGMETLFQYYFTSHEAADLMAGFDPDKRYTRT
jgi:hypothetical protein